ncbi:MAG: virulence RhuM family protein [Clostridiales Family XIII bacterium]|nr:virulence RhuM family protein [Clostridiales Family XIII bacterium]
MKSENNTEIIIYQTADGKAKIDVRMQGETLWLSESQMAELFGRDRSVIGKHIRNIFTEGELEDKSNGQKMPVPNSDKPVSFYSLDVILAVGYRVKSLRGTQFRQWATAVLHEYLQKGFTMNDEFLKNMGGGVYWKELLERIRDIRASEKVMYRQVLDLYATSMDYNATMPETIEFFKIVQNKLHYAVSGHTASEIIFDRANAELPFMGLTVFSGKRPVKGEVTIAKNYMTEKELFALRRMVNAFFDMAELKASQQEPMYMRDWLVTLDKFTADFGMGVLEGAGKVKAEDAHEKALREYEAYRAALPDDLTDVERAYLDTLKDIQKRLNDRGGEE